MPANDRDRDRQEVYQRTIGSFRAAWAAGVDVAVAEALHCCRRSRQVPPGWLVDAVTQLVTERPRETAKLRHRYAMDKVHYARWDAVNELRERKSELAQGETWLLAYEAASKMLRGTEARGSPHAMKTSYDRVARDLRDGRHAKYMASRLHAGIDK